MLGSLTGVIRVAVLFLLPHFAWAQGQLRAGVAKTAITPDVHNRKVYLAAVIILISALWQGPSPRRLHPSCRGGYVPVVLDGERRERGREPRQPARTPGANFGTLKLTFVPAPGAVSTTSPYSSP